MEAFGAKFSVVAFDMNAKRPDELQESFSRYDDVQCTTDPRKLKEATHFVVSVPTMLRSDRSIDLSYLNNAINTALEHARPSSTVVIKSSVAIRIARRFIIKVL